MSSIILRELFDTTNIHCDKWFVVRNGQEALAAYVREEMDARNWSTYDVVRESGGLITSNSTVWNVVNKRGKEVKDKTLRGLAKAFQVPPEKVFDIYLSRNGSQHEPSTLEQEVAVLFYGWDNASDEDKRATLESIRMIAEGFQRRRARKKK